MIMYRRHSHYYEYDAIVFLCMVLVDEIVLQGEKCMAVYSGSKFYVEGLSQSLRKELVGTGVKVTCIQPGDTLTDIGNDSTDQEVRIFLFK